MKSNSVRSKPCFRILLQVYKQSGAVVVADLNPEQPLALHNSLQAFGKELGFYDVFVIAPDGLVIYSAAREADFQSNLINGPYANSNLAKVFQRSRAKTQQVVLEDFSTICAVQR